MAKRSFSFLLDDELREAARIEADAIDRTLGWWVNNLIAEKIKELNARVIETPPTGDTPRPQRERQSPVRPSSKRS